MRVLSNGVDDLWRKGVGRQDHGGVARVNAGEFDVLQHSANHNRSLLRLRKVANIRNTIHVHFGRVFQKFIHQHRALRGCFNGEAHVMLKFGV